MTNNKANSIAFTRKVQNHRGSLYINLPSPIANQLDIKSGDECQVTLEGNGVRVMADG